MSLNKITLNDVLLDNSNDEKAVLHCTAYDFTDGCLITNLTLGQVPKWLAEHPTSYVWLALFEPSLNLMMSLQHIFELHELAIEDSLRPHQRTKVEHYGDVDFVVLQTQTLIDDKVQSGMISVFLGERFVISVHQGRGGLSFEPVKVACEQLPELLTIGPLYLLHCLLDFAVDQFMLLQDHFQLHITQIEHNIFQEQFHRGTLKKIYRLKSELVKLRLVVKSYQEVCQHFMHSAQEAENPQARYDVVPYYRDVLDHVLRTVDALETYNEMLNVSMDTYVALVGINQNDVVKRLASWAAILAIPTLFSSLYGMNFKYMPELEWRWGYYLAILMMLVITYLVYLRLKKRTGFNNRCMSDVLILHDDEFMSVLLK